MKEESNVPNEFSKLVAEHYAHLTKSEKRVATYILEHQDEAAFMPALEIATSLGIERTNHGTLRPFTWF